MVLKFPTVYETRPAEPGRGTLNCWSESRGIDPLERITEIPSTWPLEKSPYRHWHLGMS